MSGHSQKDVDERQEFNTNCFGSLIACGVHSPPAISVFMFLAIVSDVPIETPDKLESFTAFTHFTHEWGFDCGWQCQ